MNVGDKLVVVRRVGGWPPDLFPKGQQMTVVSYADDVVTVTFPGLLQARDFVIEKSGPSGITLRSPARPERKLVVTVEHTRNGRLQLGPGIIDERGTASLLGIKRLPLRQPGHDIQSALLFGAGYAQKHGVTVHVYQGNSNMHIVWRVSTKPGDYLNPINNTGSRVAKITPDLTLTWHDVHRGGVQPNASARDDFYAASREWNALAERLCPAEHDALLSTMSSQSTGKGIEARRQKARENLARSMAHLGHPKPVEPMEPNGGSYYVWPLRTDGTPLESEGPYGPHDLEGAKTYARISATEGKHDRAVSRGVDPTSASFEIVRRYKAGSGNRVI